MLAAAAPTPNIMSFLLTLLVAVVAWCGCPQVARATEASNDLIYHPFANMKAAFPVSSNIDDMKIVGGKYISIFLRPYMAAVGLIGKNGTVSQNCGASILDSSHLLTAAHCMTKRAADYSIRVGSTYRHAGGQVARVNKFFIHPKFDNDTFRFDIAVIRLTKPLKLGNNVGKVDIVKVGTPVNTGDTVALMGWGYQDPMHSTKLPTKLSQVEVQIIDHSECEDDYESFQRTVYAEMFCTMTTDKDSCQGDSGGPVVAKKTGKQIGIVSWGMGCAQMGFPGVYTNLADKNVQSFITTAIKSK